MAEFPSLPLFTDAIIADTSHLTDAEFGLYTRLLMLMWRTSGCRLPNDADWISRKMQRDFGVIKPMISEFFNSDGNYIYQKRLYKEWNYLRTQSQKQSVRANKRWNKEKDSSLGNATSRNAPHPTYYREEEKDKSFPPSLPLPPKPKFTLPEIIPPESWADFLEMRHRARKPMTPKAKQLAVDKLIKLHSQGYPVVAVINQSVERGWLSFFPIKDDEHGQARGSFESNGRTDSGMEARGMDTHRSRDSRSPAKRAIDEGERIIAERAARYEQAERAANTRIAITGKAEGGSPNNEVVDPSLCDSAGVRGKSRSDGSEGCAISADSPRLPLEPGE